jgi:quinol-cytochrome oxidoreductase complex cytochrome b subunit
MMPREFSAILLSEVVVFLAMLVAALTIPPQARGMADDTEAAESGEHLVYPIPVSPEWQRVR